MTRGFLKQLNFIITIQTKCAEKEKTYKGKVSWYNLFYNRKASENKKVFKETKKEK